MVKEGGAVPLTNRTLPPSLKIEAGGEGEVTPPPPTLTPSPGFPGPLGLSDLIVSCRALDSFTMVSQQAWVAGLKVCLYLCIHTWQG